MCNAARLRESLFLQSCCECSLADLHQLLETRHIFCNSGLVHRKQPKQLRHSSGAWLHIKKVNHHLVCMRTRGQLVNDCLARFEVLFFYLLREEFGALRGFLKVAPFEYLQNAAGILHDGVSATSMGWFSCLPGRNTEPLRRRFSIHCTRKL